MRIVAILIALTMTACASSVKKTESLASHGQQTNAPVTAPKRAETVKVQATGDRFVCTKDTDERRAEIKKAGDGCSLEYTKFGKATEVAGSTHATDHCKKVLMRIESKLRDAGYQCR
jgi:hypothetical protein